MILVPDQQSAAVGNILASVAAQSGLNLMAQRGTLEFVRDLLANEQILASVCDMELASSHGARGTSTLIQYFKLDGDSTPALAVLAARELQRHIGVALNVGPGTLSVALTLRDSLLVKSALQALLAAVDSTARYARVVQAKNVRMAMQQQVSDARRRLRGGEDSLENFLVANRTVASSPVLQTQLGRLTRSVDMSTQWLQNLEMQLAQAQYAEAQEVPTIAYVVPATTPLLRESQPLKLAIAVAIAIVILQLWFWLFGRQLILRRDTTRMGSIHRWVTRLTRPA
jgi:hypothetical protein